MKGRFLNVKRALVALVVWLAVSFLPLVPVMQAPVVRDPIYHLTLASIQETGRRGHLAHGCEQPGDLGHAAGDVRLDGRESGRRVLARRSNLRSPPAAPDLTAFAAVGVTAENENPASPPPNRRATGGMLE